jgi:biopolymer transport protein ExbB
MTEALSDSLVHILRQGGFVMPPLILLSITLFTTLFRLFFELLQNAKIAHPSMVQDPEQGEGLSIDHELDSLVRGRTEWRLHFDRRLAFVRIMTATAPLLGLLGTVAGMLKTFSAMSLQDGLKSIDLVASGISEALITTETGLSIAIVGLVLLTVLRSFRRRLLNRFESCEAETVLEMQPMSSPC